uniref:Uncharacterized protein n=1 Tax=Amorphochlora amoebiformis TaxID=1561963 RepID=A0A0H5BQY2_9EUKA|nr:hypothetical protein [Amorphochlora amoebiformis]
MISFFNICLLNNVFKNKAKKIYQLNQKYKRLSIFKKKLSNFAKKNYLICNSFFYLSVFALERAKIIHLKNYIYIFNTKILNIIFSLLQPYSMIIKSLNSFQKDYMKIIKIFITHLRLFKNSNSYPIELIGWCHSILSPSQ